NTIISNLIGQGRQEEIFAIIKKMVIISVSGMSIFVVILNLYPGLFLGLFGQSGDFVNTGLGTLRIVSTAMVILCIGVIWLNAVVATGKTNIVFWIEFLGIVSYLVYVWIVIEVMKMDLEVAWMSEWIYWIMLFLPSFFYLKYGNWREDLKY
ncbi:MAG TPA: MATE family efflux transporter, partial [Saprospiraceae bacterium]|nr:MATE family efflux transporter [Saprospiraceae bacterium]